MKTAISLPDPLFEALEARAKQLGVSRSHLYVQALERFLQQENEKQLTEQLNAYYGQHPQRAENWEHTRAAMLSVEWDE